MTKIEFVNISKVDDGLKERVRTWRNKDEVRTKMLSQHIISGDEHAKWVKDLSMRRDRKFWVVFIDNVPAGAAYLQNIDYEDLTSEWGFYLGEDSYRGKGLGRRILAGLMELFFGEMKFKILFTKVLSDNTAALRLYEKFGFEEAGKEPFGNEKHILLLRFDSDKWLETKGRGPLNV